ncbi:AMER1 protein, partial [Nycticryphes semicollaris]|nr:AMER1 protein [Nycticryphes semicollaris]
ARSGGQWVACGQREESGDRLPEGGEACGAAAEPPQAQPPPGKLKRTAFKLFGGKRSICTLPSFFGGRSKGQGKVASKKGLSKCRTHEGLSGAACERGDGAPLESPLEGSGDSPPCPLPSSQSAPSAVDSGTRLDLGQGESSPPAGAEGCEKKPSGEKSLPRAKKGLKGFLNSIRRHRKSKAAECEPAELPECSGDAEEATKAAGAGAESGGVVESRGPGPVPAALPVPGGNGLERSSEVAQPSCPVAGDDSSEGDTVAMPGERGPPCLPSGDLLSLLLGDVTSLKSFDSLTGCGDDIAEPDIAESSISVERSREATKRSSCLVTYQGGGEEMAVPEEAEEFLPEVWAGDGARGYGAQVSSSSLETHTSQEAEGPRYVGEALDGVDLLTPQSDQQESAPNSDEGYYDSTTPGPEDEGGDGLGELRKDRLPRDSYSGDALYEFDALMSPSLGEESLFESKVSRQGLVSYFLDFCLPAERSLVQVLDQKRGLMETEEERLAAIQKELLFWELQREPLLKRRDVPSKEQRPREKPCVECNSRAAGSVGNSPTGLGSPPVASPPPERGVKGGMSVARAESPEWRSFPGTLCPEPRYSSQKAQGSCLIQLPGSHSGLDSDRSCGPFGGCVGGSVDPGRAGMFPGYRLPEPERDSGSEPGRSEPQVGSDPDAEQAVSFSQALVEFTSSGTLFSSLSGSLGSSGSGSSFAQNLPALPTMVTFDIVDVEQEGEGECERHPELTEGEDIAEAFEEGYGRKESLADCEGRMSPGSPPGSFLGCEWGVASLPRRLRPHRPSPSMPAPLSMGRRSRSLDTESLESELEHWQVSKGDPEPGRLWWQRDGGRRDSSRARRSRSEEESELAAPDSSLSCPGWRPPQLEAEASAGGLKHWGFAPAAAMERAWEPPEQPVSPVLSLSRSVAGDGASGQPQEPEPMRRPLRPCHLPLQSEGRRPLGEGSGKKLPGLFPLGGTEPELPPGFRFACSPEKGAPCKPVGIAQGIPQHPLGTARTGGSLEHCGEHLKGRASPSHTLPVSCPSAAGNVTQGE